MSSAYLRSIRTRIERKKKLWLPHTSKRLNHQHNAHTDDSILHLPRHRCACSSIIIESSRPTQQCGNSPGGHRHGYWKLRWIWCAIWLARRHVSSRQVRLSHPGSFQGSVTSVSNTPCNNIETSACALLCRITTCSMSIDMWSILGLRMFLSPTAMEDSHKE